MTDQRSGGFRPLHLPSFDAPFGYLPVGSASLLVEAGVLDVEGGRLVVSGTNLDAQLADASALLVSEGLIQPLRGELMPVRATSRGPVLCRIDRSAMRHLGLWATKVHVHGLVEDEKGRLAGLWLSRRSAAASHAPGCLDTLVAGGQAASETEQETVVKEAWEEAGLNEGRLARLVRRTEIELHYASDQGFHQERILTYDLALPQDFHPRCVDGEIEAFELIAFEALGDLLRASDAFKYASWIATMDLAERLRAGERGKS
ncbi:NUDIX domain-containing protein [Arsenicitalea aurantiaca]|uniref:NUDIX domain-containing protein n=1 Tax=Arsenicitalea aurantiaca TaxID=1783274 RepID=A0A433XA45_9HYPH|nr:NUDIX domain-containing protein [Arsenicitalea aurantiaca]RUT30956.1 NUDIX domain-containing protein [Arsenicitalea aurantiaca]